MGISARTRTRVVKAHGLPVQARWVDTSVDSMRAFAFAACWKYAVCEAPPTGGRMLEAAPGISEHGSGSGRGMVKLGIFVELYSSGAGLAPPWTSPRTAIAAAAEWAIAPPCASPSPATSIISRSSCSSSATRFPPPPRPRPGPWPRPRPRPRPCLSPGAPESSDWVCRLASSSPLFAGATVFLECFRALVEALGVAFTLGADLTGSAGTARTLTLFVSSSSLPLATNAKKSSGAVLRLETPAAADASAAHADCSAAAAPTVLVLTALLAGLTAPRVPALSFFKRKSRIHVIVPGGKKPVPFVHDA
mmetsp:Transcript_83526/g.235582  ORF Transcript_83526/g.235582 Transcript_83526/m.235582 type:complete len:306 (+) Transcript_83526:372-1289(+)